MFAKKGIKSALHKNERGCGIVWFSLSVLGTEDPGSNIKALEPLMKIRAAPL